MAEIELEKTYLAKYIPSDIGTCKSKEIVDLYFPKDEYHPTLRLRNCNGKMELTKKTMVGNDASHQIEETIRLDPDEFQVLNGLPGKRLHKRRYYYPYQNFVTEIGVFLDDLAGLVLVDVEFTSLEAKNAFAMPDFCLADVTEEEWAAGGVLSGKAYTELETILEKYQYQKLILHQ